MTPYYADPWLTVFHGDARAVMAAMEPESVHCVVTSPPYWGLRDYGQTDQLGLEPTPEAYVENMVAVFREVRRALRSDGTVWLNLGDSYASSGVPGVQTAYETGRAGGDPRGPSRKLVGTETGRAPTPPGLKPKDLVGIPWRVAFALQADGWYLRSDIIWAKPNPMPESVTDRPTKAHEYLFLLSKSPRYYYDADAVRETSAPDSQRKRPGPNALRGQGHFRDGAGPANRDGRDMVDIGRGPARNLRSVWTIATAPYPGAHFATFPPKLVEPCIKAGTSERGVCPECGAPWVRVVERERVISRQGHAATSYAKAHGTDGRDALRASVAVETTGWVPAPSCACCVSPDCILPTHGRHNGPIPATVLDPFAGSGTTGMVAQSLSRRAVLIDLSMDYLGQLMDRNRAIPLGLESA